MNRVEAVRKDLIDAINLNKKEHYDRLNSKLRNPKTSSKAYWSILKSLYCDRKSPVIPPLLINNNFVTNFKTKAKLFNFFFFRQCSLLQNSSTLPYFDDNIIPNYPLSSFECHADDILKLIRSLDSNKSHGYDGISVRMIKLCDEAIVKPLCIIFSNCLKKGIFPSQWKKGNIIPIHKKGPKNIINNYRPISLLPIFAKLFEKIICNSIYYHLNTISCSIIQQSGFRSADSCTNQLIAITHNIYSSFDVKPTLEVRGVFLDISKAFDRVWHEGLLLKLKKKMV